MELKDMEFKDWVKAGAGLTIGGLAVSVGIGAVAGVAAAAFGGFGNDADKKKPVVPEVV